MIKKFSTEEVFEAWLGEDVLPSKTIAYVAETKKYMVHTNNKGVDEILIGTYADLLASGKVPYDTMMEIALNEENMKPKPQPSGDLEQRVGNLEIAQAEIVSDVTDAKTDAQVAKTNAQTAKSIAEGVNDIATEAKNTADEAKSTADDLSSTVAELAAWAEGADTDINNIKDQIGTIDTTLQNILGDE